MAFRACPRASRGTLYTPRLYSGLSCQWKARRARALSAHPIQLTCPPTPGLRSSACCHRCSWDHPLGRPALSRPVLASWVCPLSSGRATLEYFAPSLILITHPIPPFHCTLPTLRYARFSQPGNSQTACLLDFQPNLSFLNPHCPSQHRHPASSSTTQARLDFRFDRRSFVFFCFN